MGELPQNGNVDILILEDMPRINEQLVVELASEYTIALAQSGEDLRTFLERGGHARCYFLDDVVPDRPGENPERHFLENARRVSRHCSHASIVYVGSIPLVRERSFCREEGIPIIGLLVADDIRQYVRARKREEQPGST